MNGKVIELREKEQKDLFCIAWHFTNFIEDMKEKKIASFATPCETCKYQRECLKDDHFDAYNHFETLTKLTGVRISPLIGFRNLVKRGLQSFSKEDTVKNHSEPLNK